LGELGDWEVSKSSGQQIEEPIYMYFAILDGHFTFAFAMGQQTRTLGHGCSLSEKIDNSLHYMGTQEPISIAKYRGGGRNACA
jgi:hypothetical protein